MLKQARCKVHIGSEEAQTSSGCRFEVSKRQEAVSAEGYMGKAGKTLNLAPRIHSTPNEHKALKAYQRGDSKGAFEMARRILLDTPDSRHMQNLVGVISLRRGRPDLALEGIEKAILEEPNFWMAHRILEICTKDLGILMVWHE